MAQQMVWLSVTMDIVNKYIANRCIEKLCQQLWLLEACYKV